MILYSYLLSYLIINLPDDMASVDLKIIFLTTLANVAEIQILPLVKVVALTITD